MHKSRAHSMHATLRGRDGQKVTTIIRFAGSIDQAVMMYGKTYSIRFTIGDDTLVLSVQNAMCS